LAKIGGLLQQAHQAAAQVTVPDEPEGLADARARLAEISDAPTRLAGSLATLAGHEDTIRAADDPQHVKQAVDAEERITEARDTLAGIEPTVGLDDTRSRHAELTDRARALQAESDRLAGQRVETKTLLDLASAATARLEEITGTLTTSRAKAAQLAMLDKAYGPSGIPLLILESVAVPAIEEHANEIVSRLGLPDFRIEIRTQAEKKDGGLRDALDVIVTTGVGERPYESFSGGEQTRLAIALRVALARLLATRRGADCRMLVVDEPDYLDTDGRARLVDVLRELEQTGVFDQVVLVSHESDLRDAFDQVIEVERGSDGWSRIVGGRVAVLA
jgi:exonuclease SbcC